MRTKITQPLIKEHIELQKVFLNNYFLQFGSSISISMKAALHSMGDEE